MIRSGAKVLAWCSPDAPLTLRSSARRGEASRTDEDNRKLRAVRERPSMPRSFASLRMTEPNFSLRRKYEHESNYSGN